MDFESPSGLAAPEAAPGTGHGNPPPLKLTGTIPEAGAVLGIGKNQAYEAARRGEIPIMEVGKRKIVKWQAFLRMLGAE